MRRTFIWTALSVIALAAQLHASQHSATGRAAHPTPAPPPSPHVYSSKVIDATNLGSPLVLDSGWRVGVTADPNAANPDFDDSSWAVRDASAAIADVEAESQSADDTSTDRRFAWFRLHLRLAPHHGPVALLVDLPVSINTTMTIGQSGPGVDVYANGKEILPGGPHPDSNYKYQQISRLYQLDIPSDQTSVTLSLRTLYIPFGLSAYTNFFASRTFRLGSPSDLERSLSLWYDRGLFERLPRLITGILLIFLSLFLLTLYFTQKGHREYLWLALHELVQAPLGFIDLAGSTAHLDQLWYAALLLQLLALSAYLFFEFLVAFLALPRRWYIRLLRYSAIALAGIGPTLLLVGQSSIVGILLAIIMVVSLLWVVGWWIFVFLTLMAAALRRNFEAGLLLIPLVLTIVGIAEPILSGGIAGGSYHSPLTIQAGPIPIHFASIADLASMLAIVIIILVRFLRIHHEQERTSGELAAARSVQELMIPREKLETPGYEVDSVYNPATEVGGDFFHLEPTQDGGLLVILGDVAGHGLQAAMNVSMLMGALRRTPERSPGKILESLNRVLLGSASFTTCQVAWFGADGEMVIANAGHLPPYLNSQEVRLPGGLPLGVVPDVSYDEVRLFLHPGDRILMLSDGVVEARQADGELFGFARVHNLSNQTAFYIADAAKEFGQEDDITVLTVRRVERAMAA